MKKPVFTFTGGNVSKLLAIPKYAGSFLLSKFVPRKSDRWVFGSGIGVGEGALVVARRLKREDAHAQISWLTADADQDRAAAAEGFAPVRRKSAAGYWATLRAGQIVITHGFGDANRYGVFGGYVVQLWHGVPLKLLHLDSPSVTSLPGAAGRLAHLLGPAQKILAQMYSYGDQQISLFVAGAPETARRLRSAFRLDPGRVRVLGDPRVDELAAQAESPAKAAAARARILTVLGLPAETSGPLVIYAPTWRNGDEDPAVPTDAEVAELRAVLERIDGHLAIRPHRLGFGPYERVASGRIHLLGSDLMPEVTGDLGAFDALITDYSSIAIDYSVLGRPIIWFAPDLEVYAATRGLYEPLEDTVGPDGSVFHTWGTTLNYLEQALSSGSTAGRFAHAAAVDLSYRFHSFPKGASAARVLRQIRHDRLPESQLVESGGVFFESFYGRQVSDNPLAIDAEVARRFPALPRYWSVTDEDEQVPQGAQAVLVGSPEWFAARRRSRLLVVNDWLRYGFRARRGQHVLQTWHGTMLKKLAIAKPDATLRSKFAAARESGRWDLLLSQNPHSTAEFRRCYAYRGPILETGYPRDDRLVHALDETGRPTWQARSAAARVLGADPETRILVYVPTWRYEGTRPVELLDPQWLAERLGADWTIVVRGHTRAAGGATARSTLREVDSESAELEPAGPAPAATVAEVIDASAHPDVADLFLAADLLITDYSSVMFDAAITGVPMLFFAPDKDRYDGERGFTFDFDAAAPGPVLTDREALIGLVEALSAQGSDAGWVRDYAERAAAWRERFIVHDDGHAAARVVDDLVERGWLG
ncbi:CDP-glycerol glycerophosphotransferase family protein [Brevibacterium sp. 91QC2O2]|uniref:CDP-glycerol glycerophosphotransferase family protein n=1 Tax=Brevibacterium sp. 91QC2O2 TaxID=2968458 RepID=UPI00211C949C|nr:CDP-glycerol glycerophosphotransferase family protein [Brevibacterium sp. 91QC2O2]MCQ9368058.1 CDP-glycerol glycerophosphotransferase family protein [Brevibacterium sp. 91QC2O2]